MRPRTRQFVAGAGAMGLSYALLAVLILPWKSQLLDSAPDAPYWIEVGWIVLGTHGVELLYTKPGVLVRASPVYVNGFYWLLVVPGLANLLLGFLTVRTTPGSVPVPTVIGVRMAVSYCVLLLTTMLVFRTSVTTAAGTAVTVTPDMLSLVWIIPAMLLPLVFGSVGAIIARSPLLPTGLVSRVATDDQ